MDRPSPLQPHGGRRADELRNEVHDSSVRLSRRQEGLTMKNRGLGPEARPHERLTTEWLLA